MPKQADQDPTMQTRPFHERVFVVQKHWASHLHYDFRLELSGTLKSWVVPKGPSMDPAVRRMAIETEDHALAYSRFEGTIPRDQYGAGRVIIWDEGVWIPEGDPQAGYRNGHLTFTLKGGKMRGRWALIRMQTHRHEKHPPWLLIKMRDSHAHVEQHDPIIDQRPSGVLSEHSPQSMMMKL
ncbi:DNA polymerase ligase N-terminal domain-containing protein [Castellaniella ginsengisoli]